MFHDVVGDGFNVDHILIGPAGVFTVETKTHSKPKGNSQIVFDGETIRIDGFEPDRDPGCRLKRKQAGYEDCWWTAPAANSEYEAQLSFPVGL